jgi:hypothetical protein
VNDEYAASTLREAGGQTMILAATADGVHDIETAETVLDGHDVSFLARRATESWAVVGGATVMRDAGTGWREVARLERGTGLVAHPISNRLLIGTTGAHVVRVDDCDVERLASFDCVPGRDSWKNPAAAGRPDVWSIASDRGAVFVSVHVGGLWRSRDDGQSWTNVLVPATDVHQVAATDGLIGVAAEGGFGFSHDGGDSWTWTTDGLHAAYLQCVAFSDDAVYVGASSGPFADDAAVYRASPTGSRFERRSTGLPDGFAAIGPYHLAAAGDTVAVAAWFANTVLASRDAGETWAPVAHHFPTVHSLVPG